MGELPIVERTRVGIVGAGPAGLTLAHLLAARGIESVVLEARDREYVEHRVRAGVLEHPTVELLRELGLTERLDREGLVHHGIALAFDGERHRIDFQALVGKSITVYGQQEVVRDLIAARLAAGGPLRFGVSDVEPLDLDADVPRVRYVHDGVSHEVRCQVVAGCDGFHGVCRPSIPTGALRTLDHEFPFSWLGILAEAAPTADELIYANHANGFALDSMRSPTVTRLYLQVPNDARLEDWPDDRIWSELATRLPTGDGFVLNEGPILERGITAMRCFVATPMAHGSLVLAGDAAHIVPPTGAKGMNLAIADVAVLADVLEDVLVHGRAERLGDYSAICARRIWRAEHFSWWMTSMLHRLDDDEYRHQLQLAELRFTVTSEHGARALAENYVGLPFGWGSAPVTWPSLGRPPAGVHPPLRTPAYASTRWRAPGRDPIVLPAGLADASALVAPVFGDRAVEPSEADLTRGPAGEAVGQRIIVTGRVLDGDGTPLPSALVEIRQANASGRYRHAGDRWPGPLDPNFVGGGRALTGPDGTYRFTTVRPGAYPWKNHQNVWRPAHIHFSLFGRAFVQRLVTQMYLPDDPLFFQDPIFNSVPDPAVRRRLVAVYDHDVTEPEWALGLRFDIVLRGPGATPTEADGG